MSTATVVVSMYFFDIAGNFCLFLRSLKVAGGRVP